MNLRRKTYWDWLWVVFLGFPFWGCSAGYFDDRVGDLLVDLAVDLAAPADGGADGASLDGAGSVRPISRGVCAGQSGYLCMGEVDLVVLQSGAVAISLGADFSVSAVPGARLVLSGRAALGRALDPQADLDLGALRAVSGAGSYPVAGGDGGRRQVFVFSVPLGIAAGQAALSGAQ